MKSLTAVVWAGWFAAAFVVRSDPGLRVVPEERVTELLQNGSFEEVEGNRTAGWRAAPKGFGLTPTDGRHGSHGLICENPSGTGWFGASQTIVLNRTNPAPLIISGWSKAANVTGSSDSDYSLYVDLTYADGTPLWGQTSDFSVGTHDWERRKLVLFPQKPVRALTLHCLFRGHAGKVWFDDVAVAESVQGTDIFAYQGTAVQGVAAPSRTPPLNTAVERLESKDGLSLTRSHGVVTSLQVDARALPLEQAAGFLVRDVAAGSDFFTFPSTNANEVKLGLQTQAVARANHLVIQGRLSDLTAADRAVTLVFALPFDASGWTWGDDIRGRRVISGATEFANNVAVRCGATGAQSLYPIAAVWDGQSGIALGIDLSQPAVFRLGYHAGLKQLFLAYDFALVKETRNFPSSADFRFVLYRFDPAGGFRAAWEKYMAIFPDYFVVRSKQQGLWMPFTDVSKVQGWADFGFRYHEGNNNVRWDDDHGILSFRYTEPMTWWMPMAPDLPRTQPEAGQVRDSVLQKGNAFQRRMAEVTRLAAMENEAGEPALLFRNTPWANGAVWSLDPNPWLGAEPSESNHAPNAWQTGGPSPAASMPLTGLTNAATVYWNADAKKRLYGPGAIGQLDGEYLDSLEGYVTAELNFRRAHFQTTTVPLTFSLETHRPALFKGLAVFEFAHWMAQDVHQMGKLMFANGVPYRFTYLCPWFDVLGTETDWLEAGQYRPAGLATMDLWRTLSGGKPYLLLMNTDYDQFTPELVEKYFQRALFYGMWPGFFSHNAAENPYWQNPRWYERDRPLFRKYIPLVKQVAEAGWQPVPHAVCQNEMILVERFGPGADGRVWLTLFNDTPESQAGTITIDAAALGLAPTTTPRPLLGDPLQKTATGWNISLGSQQAAVWQLGPPN
jgi:hypothetical protein